MKPYSYYESTTIEYPRKCDYTLKYYYRRGRLLCIQRPFTDFEAAPSDSIEEVAFDEDSFNAHARLWSEEKLRLESEFKEDIICASGVEDRSKAERCFSLAWDYGCSGGLEEVHAYFKELTSLVKSE